MTDVVSGLTKPATFDRLQKKAPLEKTVPIYLSDELTAELMERQQELADKELHLADTELRQGQANAEAAKARFETMAMGLRDEVESIRRDVDNLKEQVEAETVHCKFRSIGRKAYEDLMEAHPPTPEDFEEHAKAGGKGEPAYSTKTFSVALIAASCVEPKMTEAQVQELFDRWNFAEIAPMWVAALEVNNNRRAAYLGKG